MNFTLFQDILKEKVKSGKLKYSQGRVWLFVSIVCFYTCLGFLTWKGMHSDESIDLDSFGIVVESLKWALALFAGYVFGGKGLRVAEKLTGSTKKEDSE